MNYTKNSVHTVTIEGYSSQGEGVGRLEGMAVFVKGGLRGEQLRVALTKVDKRCAWARIVDILTHPLPGLSQTVPTTSCAGAAPCAT